MFIGAQVAGRVYNSFLAGEAALSLPEWQQFWYLPAAFAAAVAILFAVLFRDRVSGDAEVTPASFDDASAAAGRPAGVGEVGVPPSS
jgi:hypothetical protein